MLLAFWGAVITRERDYQNKVVNKMEASPAGELPGETKVLTVAAICCAQEFHVQPSTDDKACQTNLHKTLPAIPLLISIQILQAPVGGGRKE